MLCIATVNLCMLFLQLVYGRRTSGHYQQLSFVMSLTTDLDFTLVKWTYLEESYVNEGANCKSFEHCD